jgi:hypothetical protein
MHILVVLQAELQIWYCYIFCQILVQHIYKKFLALIQTKKPLDIFILFSPNQTRMK